MSEDNKRLHEDLDKWSSYAARLQTLTNQPAAQPAVMARPAPTVPAIQSPPATPARTTPTITAQTPAALQNHSRTHTVRAGDTVTMIAKKYGVKPSALMTANPNLDPRRLRVGQLLQIPNS